MILCELRQVLVDIEDDGDGDDEGNGEEVGADELPYDIPVDDFQKAENVEPFYPL